MGVEGVPASRRTVSLQATRREGVSTSLRWEFGWGGLLWPGYHSPKKKKERGLEYGWRHFVKTVSGKARKQMSRVSK